MVGTYNVYVYEPNLCNVELLKAFDVTRNKIYLSEEDRNLNILIYSSSMKFMFCSFFVISWHEFLEKDDIIISLKYKIALLFTFCNMSYHAWTESIFSEKREIHFNAILIKSVNFCFQTNIAIIWLHPVHARLKLFYMFSLPESVFHEY